MSRGRRRRLLPTACKTSPGGQPARPYKEEDHDCRYPRQAHVTSTDGTKIGVTVSGQGRPLAVSPGDHSAHTIQQEADDIAAVLDLVGPDAIPLGHS